MKPPSAVCFSRKKHSKHQQHSAAAAGADLHARLTRHRRNTMAAQMDASQLSMDVLFSVDGTATPLDDLLLELATSPVGTDGSLLSLTEALVSPGALVGTSGAADVCGGYDNQVPCCDVQPPLAPEARPNSPVCKPCAVSCVPPVRCELLIPAPHLAASPLRPHWWCTAWVCMDAVCSEKPQPTAREACTRHSRGQAIKCLQQQV